MTVVAGENANVLPVKTNCAESQTKSYVALFIRMTVSLGRICIVYCLIAVQNETK